LNLKKTNNGGNVNPHSETRHEKKSGFMITEAQASFSEVKDLTSNTNGYQWRAIDFMVSLIDDGETISQDETGFWVEVVVDNLKDFISHTAKGATHTLSNVKQRKFISRIERIEGSNPLAYAVRIERNIYASAKKYPGTAKSKFREVIEKPLDDQGTDQIVEFYHKDISYPNIAKRLNAQGYRSARGIRFDKKIISQILLSKGLRSARGRNGKDRIITLPPPSKAAVVEVKQVESPKIVVQDSGAGFFRMLLNDLTPEQKMTLAREQIAKGGQ